MALIQTLQLSSKAIFLIYTEEQKQEISLANSKKIQQAYLKALSLAP